MKMRTFVTAAACAALMIGTSMGVYAQENGQTQLSLPVDNVVEGDVPSDLDYQFILTGENGAPMPADTNDAGDAVLTIKGAGSGNFGAITYTEPENYTYTISEQMDPADHYTFDGTTYTVKVRVFSDENGQLTDEKYREVYYYDSTHYKYIEGNLDKSQRNGDWFAYHKNGNLCTEAHYVNGKEEGEYKVYHDNGYLYYFGKYENGKKVGVWKFYDEQGQLIYTQKYESGVLKETIQNQ